MPTAVAERRKSTREPLFIPVRMISPGGKEHVGMTENVSDQGVLLGTPHRFAIGDEVQIATPKGTTSVHARVVWFEKNQAAETLLWRFRVALQLDRPAPAWHD
jgi:hypothetical protein